jgi:hypothetical protein
VRDDQHVQNDFLKDGHAKNDMRDDRNSQNDSVKKKRAQFSNYDYRAYRNLVLCMPRLSVLVSIQADQPGA